MFRPTILVHVFRYVCVCVCVCVGLLCTAISVHHTSLYAVLLPPAPQQNPDAQL